MHVWGYDTPKAWTFADMTDQSNKIWTVGSCFAGIGGFELGLQWAFDEYGIDHEVKWQIEQNAFCQRILKKHWPNAKIYDDITTTKEIEPIDILIGGFPCQDISTAGKQKGIEHGEKSSLWFEMLRIIGEIRPRIVVLENVPNIIRLGGTKVVGGLAEIGYDCEWSIISAAQFGAPHLRKRWFCVATDTTRNSNNRRINQRLFDAKESGQSQHAKISNSDTHAHATDADSARAQIPTKRKHTAIEMLGSIGKKRQIVRNWQKWPTQSPFCDRNDGIPDRVARLKALGNAIVPQCSQWVFEQIIKSGLIQK